MDSAPGPATADEGSGDAGLAAVTTAAGAGGHTAVAPDDAGAETAARSSSHAAVAVGATRGHTSFTPGDAAAEPAAGAGNATVVALSVAATGAVPTSRACWGTGKLPYLLAGYLAVHGKLAHTCKRINFPSHTAQPVIPFLFPVGLVGILVHFTLRVTLSSPRTWKTPWKLCNPCMVGSPADGMAPPPRISCPGCTCRHARQKLAMSATAALALEPKSN